MIIFAGGMFLTSCDKTEVTPSSCLEKSEEAEVVANIESYENLTLADMPQLEVRDEMLYFANSEQYFKTIAIVSKMTDEELDKWEQELGFVSLRTMQNKIWDKIEKIEEIEVVRNIIEQNSEYFKFELIKDNVEILPIVNDVIYASICNEKSMYCLKKQFTKIIDEHVIYSVNKNKVSRITEKNISEIDSEVKIYNYVVSNNTKNNFGSFEMRDCFRDEDGGYCKKWNSDRMAFLEIETYKYSGSDNEKSWMFFVTAKAYGKRRYCDKYWRRYYTNLTMRNVNCRILYPAEKIGTGWKYEPIDVLILAGSRSVNNKRKLLIGPLAFKYVEYENGATPPLPVFTNIEGEASSRGVGSMWTKAF